jgi:hypothetical protein
MDQKKRRERRAETRQRASESAVLKSTISGMAVSQVLDTSPSGLRVTAPYPFPVGAQIEVLFENEKISGSVRNCVRALPTQFHIGIGEAKSGTADSFDDVGKDAELDRLTDVLR